MCVCDRDPFGVTCMYIGWGKDGSIWVANEMKCLKVREAEGVRQGVLDLPIAVL